MGPVGYLATEGAIGSQGNGLTLEGLKRDEPNVYAALLAQVQGDERKTILEMLQEGRQMKPSGARQEAARSALVGAEGGIAYAPQEFGGNIPKILSMAGDFAKLAGSV